MRGSRGVRQIAIHADTRHAMIMLRCSRRERVVISPCRHACSDAGTPLPYSGALLPAAATPPPYTPRGAYVEAPLEAKERRCVITALI